jgi:hypothetical protein
VRASAIRERNGYEQDYVMKSGIISQKGFRYFLSAGAAIKYETWEG